MRRKEFNVKEMSHTVVVGSSMTSELIYVVSERPLSPSQSKDGPYGPGDWINDLVWWGS